MNGWQFFDRVLGRLPGWPTERQWVTLAVFAMGAGMLQMAVDNPDLWKEELFKTLITVVIVTAIVNAIVAFHFAANKADETKADNTGKAFEAIKAAAEAGPGSSDSPTGKPGDPVHTVEERR